MKMINEEDWYTGKLFSRNKYPRKIKKWLKKVLWRIPVGTWCYGTELGKRNKQGKLVWRMKTITCPFYHSSRPDEDGNKTAVCSFLNVRSDLELTDQIKICMISKRKEDYMKTDGPLENWVMKPDKQLKRERRLRKTKGRSTLYFKDLVWESGNNYAPNKWKSNGII
jgi:hypothetical protein